ncbi:hypothetical protein CBM2609_A170104 [Cupriavidus taiwanensis]|nr:hypothetical protein CBM2604_A140107 [Cupriavidus taiwanensis]SOZ25845.1 hypothetical protein CBM2609_A170104 [Cupriavidus taiwanensis]SOZ45050.1 hypothetical protein CBM2610_A160103 [Cupriavidus taiwanensis]
MFDQFSINRPNRLKSMTSNFRLLAGDSRYGVALCGLLRTRRRVLPFDALSYLGIKSDR